MIDEKDEKILEELQKNSRNTTKKIAQKTNIPRVTVHDRIQKMQEKGIIKQYTTIIDYNKIEINTKAFIFVSFLHNTNVSQRELAKRISKIKGVYEVHIISGEYDLLLKVRGKSLEEIGKFVIDKLRELKGVGRTLTMPCFETVKEQI